MASILVVEDDEDNEELIRRFLRREGHCVYHALNGLAALTLAAEHLPDLIIMDIGLPGMSGCEAVQCIRGNKATMNIPILALTAHASSKEVINAIEVGVDYYELKPVVYTRLMAKISEILQNAGR